MCPRDGKDDSLGALMTQMSGKNDSRASYCGCCCFHQQALLNTPCWAVLVGMDRCSPPNILCVPQKEENIVSDGPSLAGCWPRAHIWVVMQSKVGSNDLPEAGGLLSADP